MRRSNFIHYQDEIRFAFHQLQKLSHTLQDPLRGRGELVKNIEDIDVNFQRV